MSEKPHTPRDPTGPSNSDHDQSPNSTVRAYDVAEHAEEAATRPIPGLPDVDDPVTSGDTLHDAGTDEEGRREAERARNARKP